MGGRAWGQRSDKAARHGQQRPDRDICGRRATGTETGEGRGVTDGPLYSPGRWRFEYISNSNEFKTFQSLTNPKMAFPNPKKLK
jgi:hypothetical protein